MLTNRRASWFTRTLYHTIGWSLIAMSILQSAKFSLYLRQVYKILKIKDVIHFHIYSMFLLYVNEPLQSVLILCNRAVFLTIILQIVCTDYTFWCLCCSINESVKWADSKLHLFRNKITVAERSIAVLSLLSFLRSENIFS